MNASRIGNDGKLSWTAMLTAIAIALSAAPGAKADPMGSPGPEGRYQQHNLVSDQAGVADHQDAAHLVNAWGIAFNPFGFV